MNDVGLELVDVSVRFGALLALDGVDIAVQKGEIHGLIGPNGAGKSTLVSVAAGEVAHSGSVRLDGRSLDGLRAPARARAGLGRTFQAPQMAANLTVGENIALGRDIGRRQLGQTGWLDRSLRESELTWWADVAAKNAPYPVLKLADTVRTLYRNPRVALVDEPAAGLAGEDRELVVELLRAARDEAGTTVVLIEHDVPLVFGLCERVSVLQTGRVIVSDAADVVRRDPEVIDAYLGVTA